MSKEFTKFKSEFDKKIKPKLKALSDRQVAALKQQIGEADKYAFQGEKHVTEALVPARSAGISGDKLADYMKNKDFKEAYTLHKTATESLAVKLNDAIAMEKDAKATVVAINKLKADIEKDLKKRSGRSKSKTDIEKLLDDVKKAPAQISDAAAAYSSLGKMVKTYPPTFAKTINRLLKTSTNVAQATKDGDGLPQLLVDRVLNKNRNRAIKFYKIINAKCDEAMNEAATDVENAKAPLKEASTALKSMKTINDQYTRAWNDRKVQGFVRDSKDKDKITKTVTGMLKAYTDSERKFRGIMTTIRKAG